MKVVGRTNALRGSLVARNAIAGVAGMLLAGSPAMASLYWDADGVGAAAGGSGQWDTTSPRWTLTPTGTTYAPWNNGTNDDAVLAGTGGIVQLAGDINVNSLTFGAGYLLANPPGVVANLTNTTGLIDTGASTIEIQNNLAGGTGLTKNGAGVLIFHAANSYTGPTTVNGGTLALGNTAVAGIPDASDLTLAAGSTLEMAYYGVNNDTIGSLAGAGTVHLGTQVPGYGVVTGSRLTVGASGATTTFSGAVTGAGGRLTKVGGGTMTLSGVSTYTGITTVKDGTLAVTGGNAIPDASAVFFPTTTPPSSAATLDVSVNNETIGSLGGGVPADSGSIVNLGTAGVNLTIGADNRNNQYDGIVLGAGGLIKIGTGTQAFANTVSYWTGGLTVKGGLFIGSTAARFGDPSNPITLDGGGIGSYFASGTSTDLSSHPLAVTSAGGTVRANFNASIIYSGSITGSGLLTKSGSSNFTVNGDNSAFTGGFKLVEGILTVTRADAGTAGTPALPLGTGPISLADGKLVMQPTGQSTDVFWAASSGSTFSYGQGGILYLNRSTASSFTLTIGTLQKQSPTSVLIIGSGTQATTPGSFGNPLGTAPNYERLRVTGGVPTIPTNGGTATVVDPSILLTGNDTQSRGEFLTYSPTNGFSVATYVPGTLGTTASDATTLFNQSASGTMTGNQAVFGLKVAQAVTLNLGGGTLTVGDGVHTATVTVFPAGGVTASITNGTINFTGPEAVLFSANTAAPITAVITGTGGLVKTGGGKQVLGAVNTYAGPTTISFGTLQLGINNALPTGTDVTLTTGSATFLNGSALDLAGFSQTIRSLSSTNDSPNVILGTNGVLTVGGSTSTFLGTITATTGTATIIGSSTLVKSGTGTLQLGQDESGAGNLSRPNGFDKLVVNSGGTVRISAGVSLGTVPAAPLADQITLDNGTLQIATLSFSSMTDSSPIVDPLGNNRGIVLGTGGGTIDVTKSLEVAAFNATGNVLSGSGNLTKLGAGALRLAAGNTYTGKTLVLGGNLQIADDTSLGAAPAALVADQLTLNNNAILQAQGATTIAATRGITVGGNAGQISTPNSVTLNGPLAGSGTLTKTGGSSLVLNATSPSFSGNLTVSDGTLEANASGAAGTGTITLAALQPVTLQTTAPGTTTLTNALALPAGSTASANVPAGSTLAITGNATGSNTLFNNGAGTLALHNLRTAGLVINAGTVAITPNGTSAGASKLTNLVIAGDVTPAATLDLGDNDMVIANPSKAVTVAQLKSGFANKAWNGLGIASSSAAAEFVAATSAGRSPRYALGYATGAQLGVSSFSGQSVTPASLVIKYTYYGDLNLDGRINGDDYALLDRSVAKGGLAGTAEWVNGDVNYDGVVNSADYLLTDAAYAQQAGVVLSPAFIAQREAQFGESYASQLIAAVPEPTSLGLAGLVAVGALSRRRRQA